MIALTPEILQNVSSVSTISTGRVPSPNLPSEDELLQEYTPHLHRLASRYAQGRSSLHDDLFQEGAVALVCAARRFDPTRGLRFSTLAVTYIRGGMCNFLRSEAKYYHHCDSLEEHCFRSHEDESSADDCPSIPLSECQEALALIKEQVELNLFREEMRQAFGNFTRKQRRILSMYYEDGLRLSDVARALGVSPAHVSKVLAQATTRIRAAIKLN